MGDIQRRLAMFEQTKPADKPSWQRTPKPMTPKPVTAKKPIETCQSSTTEVNPSKKPIETCQSSTTEVNPSRKPSSTFQENMLKIQAGLANGTAKQDSAIKQEAKPEETATACGGQPKRVSILDNGIVGQTTTNKQAKLLSPRDHKPNPIPNTHSFGKVGLPGQKGTTKAATTTPLAAIDTNADSGSDTNAETTSSTGGSPLSPHREAKRDATSPLPNLPTSREGRKAPLHSLLTQVAAPAIPPKLPDRNPGLKPPAVEPPLPPKPKGDVQLRSKQDVGKRKSKNDIILRHQDNKKFRLLLLDQVEKFGSPPSKPTVPKNIDLSRLQTDFLSCIQRLKDEAEQDASDQIYDDAATPSQQPMSNRISVIPVMTEDDEDNLIEDDIYDDAATPTIDDENGSSEADLESKKKQKEQEEKERKEREMEEVKRRNDKMEKKREEREAKQRKKFKIEDADNLIGEGRILEDAKGGGLFSSDCLTVKKGQSVTVIRLDNNPSNKWLVKSDQGYGYVDSSIIEIDPNIIKQIKANSLHGGDEQPVYDDVASAAKDFVDDPDVYELCE